MNSNNRDSKLKQRKNLVRFGVYIFVWAGIAISYYAIFSIFFDTPIEYEVRTINDGLNKEYEKLQQQYDSLEKVLQNVIDRDKNIYSILFNADPYNNTKQSEQYIGNLVSMTNNQLASQFFTKLNSIENQVNSVSNEFDSLQLQMILDESHLATIPSIQPVTNKELTKLASSFGMRIHPFYRTMTSHQGVDYAVSEDTRVYATADGRVKEVNSAYKTNGLSVIIDHGNGYETVYSHLGKSLVKKGQKVSRGEIIAYSGNSGLSFMPHLHYEVIYRGERQDPINYFFQELSPANYSRIIEIAQIGMQSLD